MSITNYFFYFLVWIIVIALSDFQFLHILFQGSKDFLSSVYFNSNLPFETLTFSVKTTFISYMARSFSPPFVGSFNLTVKIIES